MLTLKIENFDQLPDGGPIVFQVNQRGFDIGRGQHLDWTLPDPSRCISSKHCEVRFLDGAYWLYDVSTNGTFINRSSRRMQSPYKLANHDQLEIGDYIISVSIEGEDVPVAPTPPESVSLDDLWNNPTGVSPPIDRRELLPPVEQNSRAADFLNRVVDMPAPSESSLPRPPASPRPAAPPTPDPWAPTGLERRAAPAPDRAPDNRQPDRLPDNQAPDNRAPDGAPEPAYRPQLATDQVPFDRGYEHTGRHPSGPPPAYEPRPIEPVAHAPAGDRSALPAAERQRLEREFLRQFAMGANLPPDTFAGQNSDEFAYELGVLMRIACGNLMQLLSARAAAKTLARSTDRTMIQQSDNNPLKFMPSAEEAVRVMLGSKSASYLDGRKAFEHAFADLQGHQLATYTAMQQALKALVEDLDPEAVESAATNSKPSLLGSSKAKAWDTFAARWEAKAGRYEHGMLDAFLMLFSEFYDRASRQRR